MGMVHRVKKLYGEPFLELVLELAAAAERHQLPFYLIGGAVRDLLWEKQSTDVDFMVEGDAMAFSRALFQRWVEEFPDRPLPSKPITFPKYGTAKLHFKSEVVPGIADLDFSSARQEIYSKSGAAPEVTPGDLKSDLARRDFSINAMAIRFFGDGRAELIDMFDGQRDLKARQLRILHPQSFVDDPARLIRAVRFAVRFNIQLEADTKRYFDEAVSEKRLKLLTPLRLFDEFRKALAEKNNFAVILRLADAGILEQISPRFLVPESAKDFPVGWEKALGILLRNVSDSGFHEILQGFEQSQTQAETILKKARHAS